MFTLVTSLLLALLPFQEIQIPGRAEGEPCWVLRPTYRMTLPSSWQVTMTPAPFDTRLPIATVSIDKEISLAIHSFPRRAGQEPIPPSAQVDRWRLQENFLHELIEPVSWGGFTGLYFEGQSKSRAVYAWALQLDEELDIHLALTTGSIEEKEHFQQMRSTITLKATGPAMVMEAKRAQLHQAIKQFELLQPIVLQ